MMNKKGFYEYVKEHVAEYLPGEFEKAEISMEEVTKNNDVKHDAMVIRLENEKASPLIYMESFFEAYEKGRSAEECVGDIADARIEYSHPDLVNDLPNMENYGEIKDMLQIRLCDPNINGAHLEGKAYTMQGDFAATYFVNLGEQHGITGSIAVTETMVNLWDVSMEQIHQDALLADKQRTPILTNMEDLIGSMIFGGKEPANLLEEEMEMNPSMMGMPMFCLTNADKMNGASLIIHDDIMQKVSAVVGSDCFILPSSIHETLIIPDTGSITLPELSAMVKEVNATEVEPQDVLSDKVQYYDAAECVLENAEKRDMRLTAEKEGSLAKEEKRSIKDRLNDAKEEVKNAAKQVLPNDKMQSAEMEI